MTRRHEVLVRFGEDTRDEIYDLRTEDFELIFQFDDPESGESSVLLIKDMDQLTAAIAFVKRQLGRHGRRTRLH